MAQICHSYDVINIFSKWEATIPIILFDRLIFLDYKNLVLGLHKKISKLIKNEINNTLKQEFTLKTV
jgi:hypothetical protein